MYLAYVCVYSSTSTAVLERSFVPPLVHTQLQEQRKYLPYVLPYALLMRLFGHPLLACLVMYVCSRLSRGCRGALRNEYVQQYIDAQQSHDTYCYDTYMYRTLS